MSIAAILSLVFAALIGLAPVFLLVGRRVMASRLNARRRTDGEPAESEPGGRTKGPYGDAGSAAAAPRPARLAVSGTGDPARMQVAELRDAARIAGVAPERAEAGSALSARLARLGALERAVVYREILGPPVGLRAPGGHDPF